MKYIIVKTSNFDKEDYNEEIINLPPTSIVAAEHLRGEFNKLFSGKNSADYYAIKTEDYIPKRFKTMKPTMIESIEDCKAMLPYVSNDASEVIEFLLNYIEEQEAEQTKKCLQC